MDEDVDPIVDENLEEDGLQHNLVLNNGNSLFAPKWQQHIQHQQQEPVKQPTPVRVWPPVRSSPIVIGPPNNQEEADEYGKRRRMEMDDDESASYNNNDDDDHGKIKDILLQNSGGSTRQGQAPYYYRYDTSPSSDLNLTSSLPARLLRAPMLGSLPGNLDVMEGTEMLEATLPPPMTLLEPPETLRGGSSSRSSSSLATTTLPQSQQKGYQGLATTSQVSYGSLRDSHLRGRFLDGPSSYRDSRTGNIHRIRHHHVRFQNDHSSDDMGSSNNGGLSIAERMRQNSKHTKSAAAAVATNGYTSGSSSNQNNKNSKTYTKNKEDVQAQSSTLSKLMESCTDQTDNGDTIRNNPVVQDVSSGVLGESYFYQTEDRLSAAARFPSHALSTSLTGLELLQRGIQVQSTTTMAPTTFTTPTTFDVGETTSPDDVTDQNTDDSSKRHINMLSRSLSDPMPRWRHLATGGDVTTTTTTTLNGNNTHGTAMGFLLAPPANQRLYTNNSSSPGLLPNGGGGDDGGGGGGIGAALTGIIPGQGLGQPQQSVRNFPDTEVAFQLDF